MTSTPSGAGSGLVVAAQILEWKGRIWHFWCEVARSLEAQGQQLVLLSPWAPPDDARWPVVLPMPYAIGEFTAQAQASMARDAAWDHLLETDELYRTFLPPSRKAGAGELAALQAYVRALFEELSPDVVMGWAPPFPPSQLLLGEARRREVPSFGLEIGFVPDTLMVESHDVGFGSDLISHPMVSAMLAAHVPDAGRVSRMREAYAQSRSTRPRPSSRPVVVLLGSCPGFNLQPRSSRLIALGSPWFGTFAEAADALAATLPADATLILRPHPADVEGQRYARRPDAPGLLVPEGSIRDLVAHADVVAVLGSTRTQVEVALLDVPIVLLSRSVLWGQGIAFEFDGQDLATPVRRALAGEAAEARRAATDRLVDFLASMCLFGLAESGVSRGPEAFARFLGRFRLPGADGETADRLERFSARIAPLLATYVCREVSVAQRPMHQVLEPYLEAHLVDLVVRDGTVSVAVCGADVVGQRLATALRAQGVSVEAFIDPDGTCVSPMLDDAPVIGLDRVPALTAAAVVIASHQHEASRRARLRALPLGGPARLFGPAMTVYGDDDSVSRHEAPERLWMARATHHAARQDWPAALAALETARRARPDAPEPWHRQAIVLRTMGAPAAEVWAACERALALGGQSFDIRLDAGFAAFASGHVEAAERLAHEAAAMRPEASPAWHLLGLCARGRGAEPAAVLPLLERALAGTPVTAELALDAAGTALALGQVARADTLARRAAAERQSWPLPRHLLALCARARGASAEEIGFWMAEALARPPVSAELAYDAASLAHASGDLAEAEERARLSASLRPGWSAPWYLLGVCRRARGAAAAEILDAFSHGLAAEPRTLELVIDAGFAALDAGDAGRADALAQEAHALQPQWSVPWHLRALAARASGAPQVQILELLYRGIRCGDASAELAFDAAAVAYDLRRGADAVRYITQALDLRPGWPDAVDLQRRIARLAPSPSGASS